MEAAFFGLLMGALGGHPLMNIGKNKPKKAKEGTFKRKMQDWKEVMDKYESAKSKLYWEERKLEKTFKKPKDKNAPKRPSTNYVLYSNSVRAKVKAETGLSSALVMKRISQMWSNIRADEKAIWTSKYNANKAEYQERLEEYKRSEKYEQYERGVKIVKENRKKALADIKRRRKELGDPPEKPKKVANPRVATTTEPCTIPESRLKIMTVPQLKALCRERDMILKGKKTDLIFRLVNNVSRKEESTMPKPTIEYDFVMGESYHIDYREAKSKRQPYKLTIKAKPSSQAIPRNYQKIEGHDDNPDFWISYHRNDWDDEGKYADLIVCLTPKREMIFGIKKHSEMFNYPSACYECDPKCPITKGNAETYDGVKNNPVYEHLKNQGFDVNQYLKGKARGWNERENNYGPHFRICKQGYLTFQFCEEAETESHGYGGSFW